MSTFKISSKSIQEPFDDFLRRGGPDGSQTLEINGVYFTHNLLHITGEKTLQPIVKDSHLFMLLGEIYNYDKTLPSDIYHGINLYFQYGDRFVDFIDGEFLFIVYDIRENVIKFFTDPWSTRQLYYSKTEEDFIFSTAKVGRRLLHNSKYTFDVGTRVLTHEPKIHKWDFRQYKTEISDLVDSFEQSVLIKWVPNITLYMSGGVDSTAIALCMHKYKKPFNIIFVDLDDLEDKETVNQVLELVNMPTSIITEREDFQNKVRETAKSFFDSKVSIAGSGGDEIENYSSKHHRMIWPKDLGSIFPWQHFSAGLCRELLDYHETICLNYGIEMRSGYFSKAFVQGWLNTDNSIKNQETKFLQKAYLRKFDIKIPEKIAGFKQRRKK